MGVAGTQGAPEIGVYFQADDYAGFWRRLLVDLLDIAVFCVVLFLVLALSVVVFPDNDRAAVDLFLASAFGLSFLYFVVLKRSIFRTPGYIAGGIRIVNLHGRQPSIGSLVVRLLFAVFGPFNFLLDLVWITSDPSRQALRDKVAHTIVVKKGAKAAGTAPITYTAHYILGMSFLFPEVKSIEAEEAPKGDPR